jgi:hypothetical protein
MSAEQTIYKFFVSFEGGQNCVVTMNHPQWMVMRSRGKFFGLRAGTPEYSALVMGMVREGLCTGVRMTHQTKEQVLGSLKANYPDMTTMQANGSFE